MKSEPKKSKHGTAAMFKDLNENLFNNNFRSKGYSVVSLRFCNKLLNILSDRKQINEIIQHMNMQDYL